VDRDGAAVAAEKGFLREIGSLAFHWAFLLLLVAVIIGKGTGYVGHATIVEGETWVDARLNYDGDLRTGRFFTGGFSGTQITLSDFEDAYRDTGIPMDFHSNLQVATADSSQVRDVDVRINHPSVFNGIRIFQYGFGWAAMMRVQQGNRVLFDGPVVLGQDTPPGENPLAQPWVGVIKLATLRPQRAIVLELYPDAEAYFRTIQTGVPQPMTQANAPFIRYQEWTGRLLDTSLSGLDTRFMRVSGSGVVGEGNSVDLDRGCVVAKPNEAVPSAAADVVCSPPPGETALLMSFPELRQYSRLQISHDATVPYVLAAAILIVLGLLPALYVSRRKVWVRARPDGPGSIVQVGGFSLQRKDRFDEEFASLVEAVVTAAGGAPTAEPAEVLRP
jgi:cytochrome c biogenesis protein